MTDNEIVKALECCDMAGGAFDCKKCPNFKDFAECKESLSRCALDLINRQKVEIERLNGYLDVISYSTDKIKAEAIKEFAERLKEKACRISVSYKGEIIPERTEYHIGEVDIDNLVKEMVGDVG